MSSTKKVFSIVVIVAFLFAMIITCIAVAPQTAYADPDLPFALTAPGNVTLTKENPEDPISSLGFSYSMSKEMNDFLNAYDESGDGTAYLHSHGFEDYDTLNIYYQVDWALDETDDPVSGWHYNTDWESDSLGVLGTNDLGKYCFSSWDVVEGHLNDNQIAQATTLFPGMNVYEWDTPGFNCILVKSQLNEGQYTVLEYFEDGDVSIGIDYTQHTMYIRARFAIATYQEESNLTTYTFSDWSDPVAYGKDAEKEEPLQAGDVAAPIVTGLRAIPLEEENFNDNPLVEFTLTVPETLTAQATKVFGMNGTIRVEAEARVKGSTEWIALNNIDGQIKTGKLKAALAPLAQPGQVLPEGTEIELRARYLCMQEGQDDFYSGYSKIIGFGSDDIVYQETNPVDGTGTDETETGNTEATVSEHKCKICHICPEPLGLCIFIWILIIIVLIAIAVVVYIVIKKKKNSDKEKNKNEKETKK